VAGAACEAEAKPVRLAVEEPALERLQQLVSREWLHGFAATVALRDVEIVFEALVRSEQRVVELVALEDVVLLPRLVGLAVLWVDRATDGPHRSGLSLDPDDDALLDPLLVDSVEHAFREATCVRSGAHAARITRSAAKIDAMLKVSSWLQNPFSFLFAQSSAEERVAAYLIREHQRGRALEEILQDKYVQNRLTPEQQSRLLDRPELIHALGHDTVSAARESIPSG
jgi:hypothetical protein